MKRNGAVKLKWLILVALTWGIVAAGAHAQQKPIQQGAVAFAKSYQECVSAGGELKTGKPATCVSKEGILFVDEEVGKPCVDRCGDGVCQEMVCMALGCPCPESTVSCPKDCAKK